MPALDQGHDPRANPEPPAGAYRMRRRRTMRSCERWLPEEWAQIKARAWDCGLTPSEFVRQAALGRVPRLKSRVKESRVVYELARIGTALKVYLRRSSNAAGGLVAQELLEVFHRDVMKAIDRL